jgi:hypothetical protein
MRSLLLQVDPFFGRLLKLNVLSVWNEINTTWHGWGAGDANQRRQAAWEDSANPEIPWAQSCFYC